MNEQPQVSVCIFSYNYEKFLPAAINSVLEQNLNVPYEILISDDVSTDNSRQVILDYQKRFPELIKIRFNEKNMGGNYNWITSLKECSGKYIALLDGDDYFTSKEKLQKQYDALENDSNAVLCFHAVEEKFDDAVGMDKIVRFDKSIFTLEDFLAKGWFIRTSSTFLRNNILPKSPPKWVDDFPYRYDTILHVFLGTAGHAVYLDEPMSVWRKHLKGMSYKIREDFNKYILTEIAMAKKLNEFTGSKYSKVVKLYIKDLYSTFFFHLLKHKIALSHFGFFIESLQKMSWKTTFYRLKNKILK